MPGQYNVITATKQAQRILSWMVKQNDSVILINSDIVNNAFIGNDTGNQPIPIPPLGSVTINYNGKDVWISTSGANVIIYELPNGSQWAPSPAQIAQQINALGLATSVNQNTQINQVGGTVPSALISTAGRTTPQEIAALIASGNAGGIAGGSPLLRFTNNLGSGANVNVPANSTTQLFNTTGVNQPSYEGEFTLFFPLNSGTVPFCRLNFVWTDSVTGLTVATRHFYLTAGNTQASALTYYLAGQCRGNQLSVSITNLDPSIAGTLTWGINQISHVYERDFLVQQFFAATAPNGFTNPNGDPAAGVMVESTPTIPINSTIFRLAGVYGGKAILSVNNTSASSLTVALVDPAQIYGSNIVNQRLVTMNLNTGQSQTAEVSLPYGPVNVQLVNFSTTATASPNVGLVALDY